MCAPILYCIKENLNAKHTLSLFHLFQTNNKMKEKFCISGVLQPISILNYKCENDDISLKRQNDFIKYMNSFFD